VFSSIAMQR